MRNRSQNEQSVLNHLTRHGEWSARHRRVLTTAYSPKASWGRATGEKSWVFSAFLTFSTKNLQFKFPKSNLAKPTSQVISINIKALKTIFNWAKILEFKGQARHGELYCSPREQLRGTRHGERSQNPHGFRPKTHQTCQFSPIKPLIHLQCRPRG